ncbi:MAG: type II secretion system F family protein [Cellulomonadaceae bacterium]
MTGLWLALGAGVLVVMGSTGLRMMRTTGLEDVEEEFRTPVEAEARAGGTGAVLDALGNLFLGSVMRLYGPRRLQRLDMAIRRAGRPDGLTVSTYLRRQTGFVVLAAILGLTLLVIGQPLLAVLFAALLCAWMRLWLLSTAQQRQAEIDADLPDFLDVLGVTVLAGLSFRQAVERVCSFSSGALSQEMRTVLQEMAVGVPRRRAFLALRDRVRSENVGTFVTALLQAEELGVPLAEALTEIAADVRQERAQQVRQTAAKAAPKVSLAVTLTILPGAMILVVSAVLLANQEALGGLF